MSTTNIFLDITKRNADRTFLIDTIGGRDFSFKQLYENSLSVAQIFRSKGIKKGDRIVVSLPNSAEFVKIYFAALYAGIVVVPINPVLSASQKKYIIDNCKAACVILDDSTRSGFDDHHLTSLTVPVVLLQANKLTNCKNAELFADLDITETGGYRPFSESTEDDELIIIYTSGTTSDPKGVVHSLKSLVTNALMFNKTIGLNADSRFYNILAMTYLGGYYNLLLLPFVAEGSVVLSNTFSPDTVIRFWEPVVKHNVNTLWIVPTVVAILNDFDRGKVGIDYCRNNVKVALTGTAPLYPNVRSKFENKYNIPLVENYGLSETFFISTDIPGEEHIEGSVGKIFADVDAKVIAKSGENAEAEEEGEIFVRTKTLMKGYYQPATNSYSMDLEEDWFATGDIGYVNANNYLFITGRKKDLIIRGGINISPAAIETVLYEHDAVMECAVVGVPNNLTGEDIVGVVKLTEDADIKVVSEELKELCKAKLSAVQQPLRYLELPDFPKTSTNKIQKNKIRVWAEQKIKIAAAQKKVSQQNPQFFKPSNVVGNCIQAVSIRYNNEVYELQRKGIDVTVLSLGEAFFDIPLYPFDDLPMPALYHYTHSRGVYELRQNLLKYFSENFEISFDPEKQIIVTAGSKIAIHMALMAIVNPGDEVIIHEPAWVSYPEQIKLCYGVPVQVPYYENVYDFEKYITNRTKLIIINSPNNPTGKVFTVEELTHLNSLAKKYNLFILSDEAYSDFLVQDEQFVSLGNLDREFSHTIVVNSISKNYGISGWRLGYIISNEALTDQILKLNQHMITCPPTILQFYISKHFKDIIKITKPQILAVVEKRQKIYEYAHSVGLTCLEGSATFYMFLSIAPSKLTSEEFCTRLLHEDHICVVPGIGYGVSCDQFVRVSIGTESTERVLRGIDKIKELITKTS